MKKLITLTLIAAALVLGIASEGEAGCRRGSRGGLFGRLFHRGHHAGVSSCGACFR